MITWTVGRQSGRGGGTQRGAVERCNQTQEMKGRKEMAEWERADVRVVCKDAEK